MTLTDFYEAEKLQELKPQYQNEKILDSVIPNNQANSIKEYIGSDIGTQLEIPFNNQLTQEAYSNVLTMPLLPQNSHDPSQLDNADKRMQKITKQRDELRKQQAQTELSFTDKVPDPPQKSELPDESILNGVDDTIKELPESFDGKGEVSGFQFTQIKRSDLAYLYKGRGSGAAYYEIFERKINSQFRNVIYPKSNAFGVWAWTTSDFNKALEYFEQIKCTKMNDL